MLEVMIFLTMTPTQWMGANTDTLCRDYRAVGENNHGVVEWAPDTYAAPISRGDWRDH